MLQAIIELFVIHSIKDKRRIVKSLKDKIYSKFRVSIAEVDLKESLTFCHIGIAYVSNSKSFGESVMHKIEDYIEDNVPGRLHDLSIYSENY